MKGLPERFRRSEVRTRRQERTGRRERGRPASTPAGLPDVWAFEFWLRFGSPVPPFEPQAPISQTLFGAA